MPWLALLIFVVVVFVLYCMLIGFASSPAWVHSPAAARIYAQRIRLVSQRQPGRQLVEGQRFNTAGMFAKAVGTYTAAKSKAAPVKDQIDSSSPQPTQWNNKASALTPAASHKINRLPPGRQTAAANVAVKRTATGLLKSMDSNRTSFQAVASKSYSQQATESPSNVSALPKEQASSKRPSPRNVGEVFFDENDFDSDIDLDNSESKLKAVDHLKSAQPFQSARSVTYPSLHQSSFHTQASGSTSHVESQDEGESWAAGTQMLPWSSSPAEHLENPPKPLSLAKFSYIGQVESNNASSSTAVPEQPKKRRALPWSLQDPTADPSIEVSQRADLKSQSKNISAASSIPLSKTPKDEMYAWNATASAIKQQQRDFRKLNKKPLRDHERVDMSKSKITPIKKSNSIARPCLSNEQRHVLDLVVEQGKSVFFTGSAGTGKSVLLREIISVLRKKHYREPDRVAVTASTGLAACNVGGVTLHSFAGIGLGKEEVPELVKKIRRNQKAKQRWMRTKILIIDEISMVDGDLFDKLEGVARQIRNNGRPFGGIQLVITGDFFQLPPVPDPGRAAKFSFDAATWPTSIQHTIGLHHVFRQKDPVFAGMLNEMREGRLSEKSIASFRKLSREVVPHMEMPRKEEVEATELFPTRIEVENANNSRMHALPGKIHTYDARDGGTIVDMVQRNKLLQNCMAPQVLELKAGAQVMLIKNMDETLVNGSLGRVRGFMSEGQFDAYGDDPIAQETSGASITDDAGEFEGGPIRKQKMKADLMATSSQIWPVVRFTMSDGTTRDLLCNREVWKIELPNGEIQAQRSQVPLILAWALSIHKAQGQTLERVKVDLGKVFEKGQAYVALSRATTMEGLQVLRFDPKKVMAHERVRSFYASLSRAEHEDKSGEEEFEDHDGVKAMFESYR